MAFDAFMKIETIPGESTDDQHKEWIELLSFDHGLVQPITMSRSSGGAATAERAEHDNFSVIKALDKASPKLALACCNGEHVPSIKIELCRATKDKQKYMEYTLSDVIVATVHPSGDASSNETLPSERIGFNYGKIEWTYTETDHKTGKPKGNVKSHWDTTANTGG